MLKVTWGKTAGAAVLLFVTTADDALWLIPFVAPPVSSEGQRRRRRQYTTYQRLQHMLVFVLTIQMVVWVSVAISFGLKASMSKRIDEDLPLLGAILCWLLTLYLIIRGMCKRRLKSAKKRKKATSKEKDATESLPEDGAEVQDEENILHDSNSSDMKYLPENDEDDSKVPSKSSRDLATIKSPPSKAFKVFEEEQSKLQVDENEKEPCKVPAVDGSITTPLLQSDKKGDPKDGSKTVIHDDDEDKKPQQQQLAHGSEVPGDNDSQDDFEIVDDEDGVEDVGWGTVFSMAFLGALDELAYFPTLLIGGSFSALELSIGAFVACIMILLVITTILSKIRPILDCMDQIPLWAFTTVFAIFLTIDAFA